MSTPWTLVVGDSRSSSHLVTRLMNTDDISGVENTGTLYLSPPSTSSAGTSSPRVTTIADGSSAHSASSPALRVSGGACRRYEISVRPSTCSRSGCT